MSRFSCSISRIYPVKKYFCLGNKNINSWRSSFSSNMPQHMFSLIITALTLLCCISLLTKNAVSFSIWCTRACRREGELRTISPLCKSTFVISEGTAMNHVLFQQQCNMDLSSVHCNGFELRHFHLKPAAGAMEGLGVSAVVQPFGIEGGRWAVLQR